ncbi:phosphatase PAP2 family protein [Thorsellia anophelis]|uniref:PAP2 superfamily protein n=1 Tax=Thorsellia anophelis DSM 18579 TaxID=1123402 RepID=A0A1H9ZE27_9GAMM|nr:phosphatase PAP2 family protein [Thorsellia anophelis]SES79919.1 PAP2 superfamily protein [Thorsellia anophelis DSM 18579]
MNVSEMKTWLAKPFYRSLTWLMLLVPIFFTSYQFANQHAANQMDVTSFYFEWEKHIPFIAWTIIPYWLLDAFYGLSFLALRDKRDVDIHALRLLALQAISIVCFILFPLKFAFVRPETEGIFGWLFDTLVGFDLPYNQAPSLHVSITVVVTAALLNIPSRLIKILCVLNAVLIIISVLTTYQHHFIDIPTGLIVGGLVLFLIKKKEINVKVH